MSRVSVFRSRFFWKLYSAFSIVFLTVTLLLSWVLFVKVQSTIKDNAASALKDKLTFLAPQIKAGLTQDREGLKDLVVRLGSNTGSHVTVLGPAGDVWADSESMVPSGIPSIIDPEVHGAILGSYGLAERWDQWRLERILFCAKAIIDGEDVIGVVRVSQPMSQIDASLRDLWSTIAILACIGVVLALALGWTLTRKIMVPIAEMVTVAEALRHGQYDRKVLKITPDEMGRLGDTLNRLGAEITRRIGEMERLENIRRDFVANVSHEIKTPLTSIKGYVETLLNGAMEDPGLRVRFLQKIERNAERLSQLVQDILSLAQIEAVEDSFKPKPTEVNSILYSVISRYEDTLAQKGLRLKLNLPPQAFVVMGDKEALIQVLDNLLTNGIKYTPEGGLVTVSLSVKGDWARIDVEDTGIGISAEDLGRIFERFYRVDKARSRDLGGTGLGLSIVKHLVATMGGEVGVESTVGIGSKFSIHLRISE
jgi:signal transduction histidine kinase